MSRIPKQLRQISQYSVLFLIVASCGKKEESNTELQVGFTATENYAIDAKGTSCQALHDYKVAVAACSTGSCSTPPVLTTGDVAGPYVSFGKMRMVWTRTSDPNKEAFRVIYVRFAFRSPSISGGKYDYVLADKPLWVTWRQGPRFDPPSNPQLPDGRDATYSISNPQLSECEVLVPSIKVTKPEASVVISGNAIVYGYYEKTDGTQIPLFNTSDTINIKWQGIPN